MISMNCSLVYDQLANLIAAYASDTIGMLYLYLAHLVAIVFGDCDDFYQFIFF